jgi:hypothetical protein
MVIVKHIAQKEYYWHGKIIASVSKFHLPEETVEQDAIEQGAAKQGAAKQGAAKQGAFH